MLAAMTFPLLTLQRQAPIVPIIGSHSRIAEIDANGIGRAVENLFSAKWLCTSTALNRACLEYAVPPERSSGTSHLLKILQAAL